ncbi:MAG: PAS domain S-box protein [Acidobacteriaceae bacterium]|nr:PAS domain S-box protein [Acidobacteriaceae bacterium]
MSDRSQPNAPTPPDHAATFVSENSADFPTPVQSDEKRVEEQTEEASRWLAAIVKNSDDAIISKSLEGRITSWNAGAERIFGYTEAEAVGQPITLIIPTELQPEEAHILNRLRVGERIDHFETVRVRKDGSPVNVALTISPVRDSSGKILGASKIARDITERKRTEEVLREREEELRWVFDLSAQVPWTADPDGRVLTFSQHWVELTGLSREQLLNEGWKSVVHPEDLPLMVKAWEHALRTGDPYDVEHRVRTVSGEYCWMRSRAYPRRDSSGRIVKWYGTIEDIQERKQAQEAIVRQAQLLDQAYEAILVRDDEDRILYWNQGAERIYGWTAEEARGRISHELLNTISPEPLEVVRVALQERGHWEGELVHTTKSGERITVQSHWVSETGKPGAHVLEINFDFDLTEQKRLIAREEQARAEARAERRFHELLEAAPDAIFELATDGRIVLINRAAERLFGYSRQELLGHSVDMLVPTALRQQHAHEREAYIANPRTRPMGSGLLEGQRKDGTRFPVEISLSPVHREKAVHTAAVVRDVSERRQTEEQVRLLQERYTAELTASNRELALRNQEIERANRLKSEFLASMSHELRTPLHTIVGFAELLAEELEGSLNPKQKRFVSHIHKDSLHLLELINDILDLSKIEAGKLQLHRETFDARPVLEEVLSSVAPFAAAKSIAIEHHWCEPFTLQADRVRFKQILYNLLSNAVKFTPEGGQVSIACSTVEGWAQFCVADTGVGIAAEEQAAIFEKFHQVGATTKGVREGTGLGLPITKHLVEEHGGRLWVESQPGAGSRFYFILPL